MPDQIVIQDATEKHYPGIVALIPTLEELFLIYPNGRHPFDIEQVEQLAKERKNLTVLLSGNQVIGFSNLYNVIPGEHAFIGNVVIAKSHRSLGLGKRLVAHMIDIIFHSYNANAHLAVFNDNTPALLLYHSLGFTPYELELREHPKNGKCALINMKLSKPKQA